MPDMLAFLAGLRVDGDTITLDGEPVCYVLGHTGRQVSTVEAAEWIAEACNQASRTCATCATYRHNHYCQDTGFVRDPNDFCSDWQDKEAADA
jgi:enamine deaminase RidA (YjgF/YER057c/UK114 family)